MKKINKTKARNLFNKGQRVILCPCKTRVDNHWAISCPIAKDYQSCQGKDFDTIVSLYEDFNCNAELGRYSAFYIDE